MNGTKAVMIGSTLLSASMAHAGVECEIPMANWLPRSAVIEKAVESGWDVQRIKIDDGCYEVYVLESDGRVLEMKLRPDTLETVETYYDDHDSEDHDEND